MPTRIKMSNQEELGMRKRLLYDGHGTGEERRILTMMKNVTKLCILGDTIQGDKFTELYSIILRDLSMVSTMADRQLKLSARCDRSFVELEQAIKEQERLIKEANAELSSLHLELEYVEQLKQVSVYPNCVTTRKHIEEVEKKKEQLMERLKKYRLQIKTMIESCRCLRKIFEEI